MTTDQCEALRYASDYVQKYEFINCYLWNYLINQSPPELSALFEAVRDYGLREARDTIQLELQGFWNDGYGVNRPTLERVSNFIATKHGSETQKWRERGPV